MTSGNSVSHMPQHALAINKLSILYSIDGMTHEIECAVTKHGHPLINASQYAAAFIECKLKMAGRKIAGVAARIPELDHMGRVLTEHDQVDMHFSTLLRVAWYNI